MLIYLIFALFTPKAHAVYGGLAANTRDFQFVRYLDVTFDAGTGGCTGTLLQRGMILTAAHCVIDKQNKRAKKIVVRLKRGDPRGEEAWGASVHPDFRHDGVYLNDIAILHTFAENDGSATLPIDYAWARYKASNSRAWYPTFLNQLTTNHLREIFDRSIPRDPQGHLWAYIVGFGLTCPDATCPQLPNTARYVGKPIYASARGTNTCVRAPFDFKTAPQRFCAFTADAAITKASAIDGKSNSNFGDSGGPMFSFDAGGNAVVIGIVNSGDRESGFFTSVYDQVEFLRNSYNGANDKVRRIMFGRDSTDSSEPKVESGAGLKEVVPLIKAMLDRSDHRKSGTRMGSAVHEYYADQVTYGGKSLRRDQLRAQLDQFSTRWPLRTYHLEKVRKASSCSGAECTVVAKVVWSRYRNDNDEGQGAGSVYTWVVRREGSSWRIVSESSRPMTAQDYD